MLAGILVGTAVALLSVVISLQLAAVAFVRLRAQPQWVATGLALQAAVLPLLALVFAFVVPDRTVAAAFLMIALVPSGPTSNYLAARAGGDVAYALALTLGGTLLSIVLMPALLPPLLKWTGYELVGKLPSGWVLLATMVLLVALPSAIGYTLGQRNPIGVAKWKPTADRAAAIVFALIVVGAIAIEWETLSATIPRSGGWILLLNLATMAVAGSAAALLRMPGQHRPTVTIKCAVQNVSVAIGIALTVLERRDVAAVAACYGVCQLLTSSLFVAFRRRAG